MPAESPHMIRNRATRLLDQAQALTVEADRCNRTLTQAEDSELQRLLAEAAKINSEAAKLELATAMAVQESLNPRLVPQADPRNNPEHMYTYQPSDPAGVVRPARGRSFSALFPATPRSQCGFASFEDFLRTVHHGRADNRLTHASMGEKVGSAGGFLVPTEYAAQMLDAAIEREIVRPRCDVQPMISDTKIISGFDSSDNSGAAPFGGFTGQWLAEGAASTEVDPKFRAIELHAHKLLIGTSASNEVIQDGMSFEQLLGTALIQAIGWHLDAAALFGDGAGKPKGALSSTANPALIVVVKEAQQQGATLVIENVLNMFARLHPACATSPSACWIASSTIIPQLYTLSIGLGASGAPVFLPPGGNLAGSPNSTLLGLPVIFTEKAPALGSQGDLSLCDFSQYSLGLRQEIVLEKSMDSGWANDISRYRVKLRADGIGRWASAFTPRAGSTLSWAVTLGARA